MFTKRRNWQRWSGPRREVTAAINLASAVLEQWSGIPPVVKVRIFYANLLTETSDDPTALEDVHTTDLRRIEELSIDVDLDHEWWLQRRKEFNAREMNLRLDGKTDEAAALVEPPPLMSASVTFRLADGTAPAMRMLVLGPDRTNVEGLSTRLAEVLNRSASGPTNLPTGSAAFGLVFAFFGIILGLNVGTAIVRVFNLAPVDNRYEWQEIVVPIAAAIVTGSFFFALHWALPSLELLVTGERSRFERFRGMLISWLVAIIAGVIATAIWAAIT